VVLEQDALGFVLVDDRAEIPHVAAQTNACGQRVRHAAADVAWTDAAITSDVIAPRLRAVGTCERRCDAKPTAKAYYGIGMEGVIATGYTKNTAQDPHRFSDGVRLITELARPGSATLEVARGPRFLAIQLGKAGLSRDGFRHQCNVVLRRCSSATE